MARSVAVGEERTGGAAHIHHGRSGKLRFVGHFLEMNVAMMLGMAVGGALGIAHVVSTKLCAALWLVSMVVPMVAWMTLRGMPWRSSTEMSAAMAVPLIATLPLFWLGAIERETLIRVEHIAMAPGNARAHDLPAPRVRLAFEVSRVPAPRGPIDITLAAQ